MKELKEFEKSIISQALAEIQSLNDIPKVIEKVEGTAIGINKYAMNEFLKLVELKKKILK